MIVNKKHELVEWLCIELSLAWSWVRTLVILNETIFLLLMLTLDGIGKGNRNLLESVAKGGCNHNS